VDELRKNKQQVVYGKQRLDGIKVEGHMGTWYVLESKEYGNDILFLLEHEVYGDTAPCIIVDCDGRVVLEDVENGWDDLDDALMSIETEVCV
jgi:hypothetical protein